MPKPRRAGLPVDGTARVSGEPGQSRQRKGEANGDETDGPIGTGLGLHLCRDMVRSYDGEANLDTAVGRKTMVTVYLPGVDR